MYIFSVTLFLVGVCCVEVVCVQQYLFVHMYTIKLKCCFVLCNICIFML